VSAFYRLKDLKTMQHGFPLLQMFARVRLRCHQAALARDGKLSGTCMLRWPDALQRLISLGHRGSPIKLSKHNSLAFPVYFFEGPAIGRRVRLLMRDVAMNFCSVFIPLRNNLNSAPSRRF
jgi:hypothetical protein